MSFGVARRIAQTAATPLNAPAITVEHGKILPNLAPGSFC